MAIFLQQDIGDQVSLRVEQNQRLSGQRGSGLVSGLLEPVFGGGQVVAVQNADVVAGHPGVVDAVDQSLHRQQTARRIVDRLGRYRWLNALEFVVHRGERDRDGLFEVLVSRADRTVRAGNDHAHKVEYVGEEQFTSVLVFSVVFKYLIQRALR